jgi:tetratricopeptide (TPR) repeat protein
MGNIMISNKYIVAAGMLALLLTGCAPSLRSPDSARPEMSGGQQEGQRPGAYDSSSADRKGRRPAVRPELDQVSADQAPQSPEDKLRFLIPSTKFISNRVLEYQKKLDRWKEIDSQAAALNLNREDTEKMARCLGDIQKISNGYNHLYELVQQIDTINPALINEDEILELQKADINFMEGDCNRILTSAPQAKPQAQTAKPQQKPSAGLVQMEALIKQHADNREYEAVAQTWSKIPDNQLGDVSLNSKIAYGNALIFLHQEEKAAEIYQQVVDQAANSNDQKTDLLALRKTLADLYTASGNYPSAQKQYMNIDKDAHDLGKIDNWSKTHLSILARSDKNSPELMQYSGILRNYMGYIPEQDGYKLVWQADKFLKAYPNSEVAPNVEMIKADAGQRADTWFNGNMAEVDNLAADKHLPEAIKKLQSISEDILSPEQRLKVRDRADSLALSNAVERETLKIGKSQDLQRQWNDAMGLVDAGKYDDAIKIFNSMQDTEFAAKATDQVREVSNQAAKVQRKKAADLFIRYTKTTDPESRMKYLVESRNLLADILVKYPNIDFADKVSDNLKRVDAEIRTQDQKAPAGGQTPDSAAPVDQPDASTDKRTL